MRVSNLPPKISEKALQYVFNTYGRVDMLEVLPEQDAKGAISALVTYHTEDDAECAILSLSGKYEIQVGYGPIILESATARARSRPY